MASCDLSVAETDLLDLRRDLSAIRADTTSKSLSMSSSQETLTLLNSDVESVKAKALSLAADFKELKPKPVPRAKGKQQQPTRKAPGAGPAKKKTVVRKLIKVRNMLFFLTRLIAPL